MRLTLWLLQCFATVLSLKICVRRHFTIESDVIFQRLELPSPEKCVERCLESIEYCKSVVFSIYEDEDLGMCVIHPMNSNDDRNAFLPDSSNEPISTVYELLENCPPHSVTDLGHRISPIHQRLLATGGRDPFSNQLSDALLPDEDNFEMKHLKSEQSDHYATMKSMDEENPPNPFDSSEEHSMEGTPSLEGLEPIKPEVVLHQGRRLGDPSLCKAGAPCAPTLMSLDRSPCPARQGDPCAPKPPCLDQSCFHMDSPPPQPHRAPAQWTEWGSCSASCGLGAKTRTCSGAGCLGPSSIPCSLAPCLEWTIWGPWSLCSASCGQGERQRSRVCMNGRDCEGASVTVSSCELAKCAEWSEWSHWEGCSITCGTGRERRLRRCENGLFCPGSPFDDRACDRGPCPHWAEWSKWSTCTKTCGVGEMTRTRDCMGSSCPGASEEKLLCNQQNCPDWSEWTQWTVCDEKCGEDSYQLRNRMCTYRGRPYAGCEGSAQDQMLCPTRECSMWADWQEWSDCSVTCGQGHQMRSRSCDGGNDCEGSNSEMKFCQLSSCPYWGPWGDWGGCSVSCGMGVCERKRKCHTDELLDIPTDLDELEDSPAVFESEKAKMALIARSKHIRMMRRNVSAEVDGRVRRSPSSAVFTEAECVGPAVDRKHCDAGPCCYWGEWTDWSPCIGCGAGAVTKRTRDCSANPESAMPHMAFQEDHHLTHDKPYVTGKTAFSHDISLAGLIPIVPIVHRGKRQAFHRNYDATCHCPGDPMEMRPCATAVPCQPHQDEPAQCQWSEWGEWCGCTKCRAGREVRRRFCDRQSATGHRPSRPDPNCLCAGIDHEERTCRMDEMCYNRHENLIRAEIKDQDLDDRYIPIQSSINSVKFENGHSHGSSHQAFNKKDSAVAFGTTQFPYPVCRWSRWSEWKECDVHRRRERNRVCIGEDDMSAHCECVGLSKDEEHCDGDRPRPPANVVPGEQGRDRIAAEFDVEDEQDLDSGIEALLRSENVTDFGYGEAEILETEPENEPIRMGRPHAEQRMKCDWTRWSQWSDCTASCGRGDRLRKRRCPCGDNLCGSGLDTEMESCMKTECSERRMHPIFEIQ